MNKKYELVKEESIWINGRILYRIRALKDFNDVEEGYIGGYIESETNLSQDGNCWIYHNNAKVADNAIISDNAVVHGNAQVYGNAKVFGDAKVYDDAKVFNRAKIFGNAEVYDKSEVYGIAEVSDNARIFDNAKVHGNAKIFGNAKIYGNSDVFDNAKIYGNFIIRNKDIVYNKNSVLTISNIGSRNKTTTFIKYPDNTIHVNCGCFSGTIDEFKEAVLETHKDNIVFREDYLDAIEFVKKKFSR